MRIVADSFAGKAIQNYRLLINLLPIDPVPSRPLFFGRVVDSTPAGQAVGIHGYAEAAHGQHGKRRTAAICIIGITHNTFLQKVFVPDNSGVSEMYHPPWVEDRKQEVNSPDWICAEYLETAPIYSHESCMQRRSVVKNLGYRIGIEDIEPLEVAG